MPDEAKTETPQGGIPSTLAEIVKQKPEIQSQVDAIIETRLARDRETRGQELAATQQNLKTTEQKLGEATQKIVTLEQASATAAQTETALKETLAGLEADIPEEKRKRIPDLPADKKIRYIIANKDLFFAGTVPPVTIPNSGKLPDGKPGGGVVFATDAREAKELLKKKP